MKHVSSQSEPKGAPPSDSGALSGPTSSAGSPSASSGSPSRGSASSSLTTSKSFFDGIGQLRLRFTLLLFGCLLALGLAALVACRSRAMFALVAASLAVLTAACAGLATLGRRIGERGRGLYDLAMLVALASTMPAVLLLDVGGPVAGFLALVLLLHGIDAPPRWSIAATLGTAIVHVTLEISIGTGWLANPGILDIAPTSKSDLSTAVSTTVLYVLTFALARVYRRASTTNLARLAEAGREVAARDALLREARLDLERVVRAGERGRFTDQRLGSFVLGPVLGVGGMGEVYEATHAVSGVRAAVKLIRPLDGEARDAYLRFEREATIVGKIASPHVVRLLEVGGMEAPLPYIAMELLEGDSGHRVLEREGKLAPERALDLVRQVAEGLFAAREHNVVHRDIKPSNLFLTNDGVWKILDFGLGRIAGDAGTLTGGTLLGTLGHLAPEQLHPDAPVTHQTDVHALAIVAYRALTGRAAFVERSPGRAIDEVETKLPPAPSSLAALPREVDDVLLIALAKAPGDRFTTTRDVASALEAALRGEIDSSLGRRAKAIARTVSWSDTFIATRRTSRRAPVTQTLSAAPPIATKSDGAGMALDAPSSAATPAAAEPPPRPLEPPSAGLDTKRTLVDAPDALLRSMWLAPSRSVALVFVLAAVFSASQVPLTPHPSMRPFGFAVVGIVVVLLVVIRVLSLDHSERGVQRMNAMIVVAFAASSAFMYFFSIYADTSAFVALALLLFGTGASLRTTLTAALAIAIPHTILQVAATFGSIPDLGFYEVRAGTYARLLNQAQALSLYAMAVLLGAMFMRQARRTLMDLSAGFRKSAEREALLLDARLALERAIGIGQEGRFSGQRLGSFLLGVLLGRGGMGEVYEARHAETGALAAVKLLSRRSSSDVVARFEQEAAHVMTVESPHVVRVLEVGGASSALPFIAMERLFGTDLGDLLVRRLSLSCADTAEMVRQIAGGLAAAHARGIVHGDVTPRNVFRTDEGTWKLLDFGAALVAGGGAENMGGTPAYMAPEQLDLRSDIDLRADVYGLAVVAFRALTGAPAFAGRDRAAVIYRVLHEAPPPPSTIASVPVELDVVLDRAMRKEPASRYESVQAFADAFITAANSRRPR